MHTLEFLTYEVKESIAYITANRPQARNAMLPRCWEEMGACLDQAERDKAVFAVIVTGAGEKAFIAGGDIGSLRDRTPAEQLLAPLSLQVAQKIEDMSKPVIAAINGVTVGGGLELALACDIRIASSNAKFILPELSLGILPGAGGTQRLVRLVGLGRAKELIMAGKTWTAQEAQAYGLLMECVEQDTLLSRAEEIARTMMKKAPLAMAVVKKVLNHAMDTDLSSGLLSEQLGFMALLASADRAEGMNAFLEKREPSFTGK